MKHQMVYRVTHSNGILMKLMPLSYAEIQEEIFIILPLILHLPLRCIPSRIGNGWRSMKKIAKWEFKSNRNHWDGKSTKRVCECLTR